MRYNSHMTTEQGARITDLASKELGLKLLYLFGSPATGNVGPLSDYDFAVYFDGIPKQEILDHKIKLQLDLCSILETNAVDVVVLNNVTNPVLYYRAIAEGKLIYEVEPYRLLVEPKIINAYIDYTMLMRQHGLTR